MSVRVIWSIVLVISAVSLLILSGLFIHIECRVLKSSIILKNIYLLIYFWLQWVFIAPLAFSSCGKWGLPFVAVLGFLMVVPSLVADHRL